MMSTSRVKNYKNEKYLKTHFKKNNERVATIAKRNKVTQATVYRYLAMYGLNKRQK